jgi:hypothetical protein
MENPCLNQMIIMQRQLKDKKLGNGKIKMKVRLTCPLFNVKGSLEIRLFTKRFAYNGWNLIKETATKAKTFSRKNRFRVIKEADAGPEGWGHAGNTVSGITITAGSVRMNRAADRKIVKWSGFEYCEYDNRQSHGSESGRQEICFRRVPPVHRGLHGKPQSHGGRV